MSDFDKINADQGLVPRMAKLEKLFITEHLAQNEIYSEIFYKSSHRARQWGIRWNGSVLEHEKKDKYLKLCKVYRCQVNGKHLCNWRS